jgi:hypothetical protein
LYWSPAIPFGVSILFHHEVPDLWRRVIQRSIKFATKVAITSTVQRTYSRKPPPLFDISERRNVPGALKADPGVEPVFPGNKMQSICRNPGVLSILEQELTLPSPLAHFRRSDLADTYKALLTSLIC